MAPSRVPVHAEMQDQTRTRVPPRYNEVLLLTCPERNGELPVTLLSGFLGAGKTTLLNYILNEQKSYKVAVIVNDMAELNIDAKTVQATHGAIFQQEEQFVQMENGCICCTLRADLLKAIASIADSKKFDLILIESTGISEPMQVAETFSLAYEDENLVLPTEEAQSSEEQLSLRGRARLDTCVTVVDAANFFNYFDSLDSVCETYKDAEEEDDRNIVDLMVDQIEFSDVIIINKVESVTPAHVKRVIGTVKQLNPKAHCITSSYSKVDLGLILNTKSFNFDEAVNSSGWLQSLKEEMKPESEEYGVSSFVYRRRRPFHPTRLWNLLRNTFVVNQLSFEPEEEEGAAEATEVEGASPSTPDHAGEEDATMQEANASIDVWRGRQAQKEKGPFKGVLRSKGFLWLGARDGLIGCWSSAGTMLTVSCEQPWFAALDPAVWEEARAEIIKDFQDPFGDRRQEIVLIGFDMQESRKSIAEALDQCLCTDGEMKSREQLADPFLPWVNPFEDEEEEEEEDAHMQCQLVHAK